MVDPEGNVTPIRLKGIGLDDDRIAERANQKQNELINVSLVEEYLKHHRYNVNKLRGYERELWDAASSAVIDNYYFPINGCPWDKDYFLDTFYVKADGTVHSVKDISKDCPAHVRVSRSRWLYAFAFQQAAIRPIEYVFNNVTTWGVVAGAILLGTYETMKSHNPNNLVTQKQVLGSNESEGDLCIVGQVNSGRTKLIELLADNTVSEMNPYATMTTVSDDKIHAMEKHYVGIGKLLEKPRQKRYYVRVNGRLAFSLKCMIAGAVHLAAGIHNNREGWDAELDYWENGLRNSRGIIDVALEKIGKTSKTHYGWETESQRSSWFEDM